MSYTIPNTFAPDTGNVPVSQIDTNFTTCINAINNGFLTGTLAGRPAPDGVGNGRYYFATDANGGTLYRDNGSSWVAVAAGVTTASGISVDGARGLVIKPSDPGNLQGSQGLWVNGSTTYTSQAANTFYNLFSGTVQDGFIISSPTQFFAFNVVITAPASPTTVTYEYWNGAWTAFSPTVAGTWTSYGFTQARWTSGLVAGWIVGGSGTNVPGGNFNIRVRQTSGTTTVTGRTSLAEYEDLSFSEIVASDGSGNKYRGVSISNTINANVTGVNGLDTGTLGASTYYYEWEILNPSSVTWAGLLSLSATAPTMPVGYTAKVLVGIRRTDANSKLLPWSQTGNRVVYGVPIKDATSAGATNPTALTVTVPTQAVIWIGSALNSSAPLTVFLSSLTWTTGLSNYAATTGGAAWSTPPAFITMVVPQTVYYGLNGGTVDMWTQGFLMGANLS